jgi:hypothetical protein
MTAFAVNPGIDQLDIIGKVAPGIFAQEGRCWRFVYENAAGHGGHCMEPVTWVGRWRFTKGWKDVWSCDRHADELVGLGGSISERGNRLDNVNENGAALGPRAICHGHVNAWDECHQGHLIF